MATATAKKPTTTKAPAKPAAQAPAKETPAKAAPKEQKAEPTPAPRPTTLLEALT